MKQNATYNMPLFSILIIEKVLFKGGGGKYTDSLIGFPPKMTNKMLFVFYTNL